jgi:hypothetical protein
MDTMEILKRLNNIQHEVTVLMLELSLLMAAEEEYDEYSHGMSNPSGRDYDA